MKPLLFFIPSLIFAQSYAQTPHVVQNKVGAAAELCLQFTDASLKCVNASTSGWIPKVTNTIDLGLTGTRFRDGWFARDLSVAGTLGVNNLVISGSCTGPGCSLWTETSGRVNPYADLNVEPKTNNTSTSGSSTRRWSGVYGVDGNFSNDVTVANDLFADQINSSADRLQKLWVVDIDCSGTCPGSGGLPVSDANSVVEGSGDATKELRFEVDGFTTATIRVATFPNSNLIVAAQDFDNLFTSQQSSSVGFKATNAATSMGTAYVAGNKVEIHQGTSGNHFDFLTQATNVMRLVSPGGINVMTWDVDGAGVDSISFHGNLIPDADNTYSIGISGTEIKDIRMDGDIWIGSTRFLQGSTLGVTTGNIDPFTTGRVIGSSGLPYGSIDVSEVHTVALHAQTGSVIELFHSLVPSASVSKNLGSASLLYASIYTADVFALNFAPASGTSMVTYGNWNPVSDNTYTLGTTSARWATINSYDGNFADDVQITGDLNVSGTCTGCGSSLLTDGGATTYVTATGDNFCIGCTSTGYKGEVNGTFRVASSMDVAGLATLGSLTVTGSSLFNSSATINGNFIFGTDGSYTIGNSTNNRPGTVYASTRMRVHNGASSSAVIVESDGNGINVFNSSGALRGSMTTNGEVYAELGFFVGSGSLAGQTDTVTVRDAAGTGTCTLEFTGGLKTGGTCP